MSDFSFQDKSDDDDFVRDPCGMPLLGAQRALGYAEESIDVTGTVVKEILALPNLMVFFKRFRTLDGGMIRVGDSILMAGTHACRTLVEEAMPARCEYVTDCDCDRHEGKSMEMLDPEEALSGAE